MNFKDKASTVAAALFGDAILVPFIAPVAM
jgi:hypothetical protein